MISNQPDQTAYLLNKLAEGHGGGGIGTLYNTTGQHTDGAMTQKATTNALGTKADALAVGQALAGKVDKEAGKGLSSNDFTNEELGKLNGIQAGAEVNVQSDWDQTDTSADDYIKNKPTIPAGAVLYPSTGQNTDGAMTQKASSDLFNNAVYVGTGSVGTLTPWVDTSDIVNGAVTASKLASSVTTFSNGNYNVPMIQLVGRTGNSSNQNKIYFSIPTNKKFATGATVTFIPEAAYGVEVIGPSGALFSESSATGTYVTSSFSPVNDFWTGLSCTIQIDQNRVTLPNNTTVTVKITGAIVIS